MCFAFEIAGSYSLCSYITSWNHVPFVRKPPALLAVFSPAVRHERAEQCTNSSPPPISSFSPPLNQGCLEIMISPMKIQTASSTSFSISHIYHHVLSDSLLVKVQVSLLDAWLCMALRKPPPQQQHQDCLHFSHVHFSWECFTRLHNKQNIAEEVSEGEAENSEEGGDAGSPYFKEL